MKKILFILIPLAIITALMVFYFTSQNTRNKTEQAIDGQKAETKFISGQEPLLKRSTLENVVSNKSIAKWGFGLAGNSLFYVDPYFSIIRRNLTSGQEQEVYKPVAKVGSVRIVSNGNSCIVQMLSNEQIQSFLLTEDSIKQLPDTITGWATSGLVGHLVDEKDRTLALNDTGLIEKRFSRGFLVSRSNEMTCHTVDYDAEALSGKVECSSNAKTFSVPVNALDSINNNDQAVLITYSHEAQGKGILYDKNGSELLRLAKIETSSALTTSEGFYVLSKPLNFESDGNEENGVAFISNSGEIKTIFDSDADGTYAFDSIGLSGGYLFLREGPMVFKIKAVQ